MKHLGFRSVNHFMRYFLLSVFLFLSVPPSFSQEPPPVPPAQSAYQALEDAVGSQAVRILHDRSIVLVSGGSRSRSILHVQWPVLESLQANAKALAGLSEAYEQARSGAPFDGDPALLRSLSALPESPLVSAGVKAAAATLADALLNAAGLDPETAASRRKPLPSLSWGSGFWSRNRCDLATDFTPAAKAFFEELSAGPKGNAQARSHLLDHLQAKGVDASSRLETDLSEGAASPELTRWIADYLEDQKRLWLASQLPERLSALERAGGARRDLKDLGTVAERLASGPDAVRALRFALQEETLPGGVRFTGAELHVNPKAGATPFDAGDEAVVSLAYWIEGLPPRGSVEVSEAGFLDEGERGLSDVRVGTRKRSSPGPHTVSFPVKLRSPGKKLYRFILSGSDGSSARREAAVEVTPRYEDSLAQAGKAEASAQACRMEEALGDFEALQEEVKLLSDKPQFKAMLAWLKPRAKKVGEQKEQTLQLHGLIDGVRLFASKEHCDFKPERARRALALLDSLPPGCDLVPMGAAEDGSSPPPMRKGLEELLAQTERRKANQEAFRAGIEAAHQLESRCSHEEAASLYAASLALLDSDPEARCGAWESEYTAARLNDLPRTSSAKAMADEFARTREEAAKASSEGDHARALSLLNPMIARIDTLPGRVCYQKQRQDAQELSQAAGLSLSPEDPARAVSALPGDDIADALAAVVSERKRLEGEFERRLERERLKESPNSLSGSEEDPAQAAPPASAEDAPAPKPVKKPLRKPSFGGRR